MAKKEVTNIFSKAGESLKSFVKQSGQLYKFNKSQIEFLENEKNDDIKNPEIINQKIQYSTKKCDLYSALSGFELLISGALAVGSFFMNGYVQEMMSCVSLLTLLSILPTSLKASIYESKHRKNTEDYKKLLLNEMIKPRMIGTKEMNEFGSNVLDCVVPFHDGELVNSEVEKTQ